MFIARISRGHTLREFILGVLIVPSSDSGSLVIDSLTAGGKLDASVAQQILWALTEGAVAAVLLIGGGLGALQTASIITGLQFTLVLLIMAYSLTIGLSQEHNKYKLEKDRKSYHDIIGEVISKREKKKNN